MKKRIALLAVVGSATLIAFAMSAQAQLSLFLDVRDNIAAINTPGAPGTPFPPAAPGGFNNEPFGGGRGDGQVMFIAPKLPLGGHIVGAFDSSLASLTLYGDYATASGTTVLSSLGVDFAVTAPPGTPGEYVLLSSSATVFNTDAAVGSTTTDSAPWDGTAISTAFTTLGGGIKAVAVPVSGAPAMYASATALTATVGTGSYRLAKIDFVADNRNCVVGSPVSNTTLGVKMSVNGLLITQVDDPANPAPGPVALSLGYTGGAAEAATGDGSTVGATSAMDDATINIQMKGDSNGDGTVNNGDIVPFLAKRASSIAGTANAADTWIGDINGDGAVNNGDIVPFLAVRAEGIACP